MEWAKNKKLKLCMGSSSKHHNPADSPYAMSKYLGEEICNLYKKSFKTMSKLPGSIMFMDPMSL